MSLADYALELVARGVRPKCTEATCPVTSSVYGYRPNLAATVIFLALFAISGIVHLGQGIKTKTWFFAIAMFIGCAAEVLGYISKLLLYKDVFSSVGFKMSIVMLTLAPAFLSAGIYYTLKHITLTFGANYSRLPPAWYTWVFVSCDLLSIVLQGVGGGIAAGADTQDVLDTGDHVMVAGLALQVFTLVIFGLLAADFAFTVYRNRANLNHDTAELRQTLKFKLFILALVVAYLAILIRCAYRVAELVGGWSLTNQILRNEGLFIGLDSVPCIIATGVLNVWHPGWCFPKTQHASVQKKEVSYQSNSDIALA
ncbi:hypothetical protein AMS68_007746 [Peltaster fructicola]|uniref:Uncharacterized protein n=1 Tax=Peltaster fructicola TaxID=286661 RepID=A0A6H0Y5X4_9PEZI|nr:hypothetical protein AMS68_007746 [Peltaster fructicola]